jgi:hypothetical protein
MPENKQLHGYVQDNPLVNALLNLGNKLRYGVSEEERMKMVNTLAAPGVKESAYDETGFFDPAAAERYTSAYLFGKKYGPGESLRPALHAISGDSRVAMNKLGVPGVGEEREALSKAEEAGMTRGAEESSPLLEKLLGTFLPFGYKIPKSR